MRTLNEQIQRLRNALVTCYKAIKDKGGTIPEAGERNMTNLPAAVLSIPQSHGVLTELTVTSNGEYLPEEGVDGFSKVTASFDTSSMQKVKVSTFKVTNDCINEDGRWEGEDYIDTSECTSFVQSFYGCTKLTKLQSRGWVTNKVTSLYLMLVDSNNLEELDTRDWDTSNVTNAYFFMGASKAIREKFTTLDLTSWNLSNLTNEHMFGGLDNTYITTLVGGLDCDYVVNNNITILNGLKIGLLYLPSLHRLDRASLRALINGLADVNDQPAESRPILNLGTTLTAKLTEEDITIATAEKGWNLA